jgi:hypothetical protein
MTDTVEELRNENGDHYFGEATRFCLAAADEIERLRALVSGMSPLASAKRFLAAQKTTKTPHFQGVPCEEFTHAELVKIVSFSVESIELERR